MLVCTGGGSNMAPEYVAVSAVHQHQAAAAAAAAAAQYHHQLQQQQQQQQMDLGNGNNDMDTTEKVKSRWTRSFFTALDRRHNEERYICDICHKDLASPSTLKLHRNTHVIERRYKCEPCQVSFHSQGHLQKHKRSSAHETRVEMTQAFGIPTRENPRPYGCPECEIAFRKHGHLAKHLRSKSHITKLESNGLIPLGTYAALEKCGNLELKERLITTNCEQSLRSLRSIASTLFQGQPIDVQPSSSPPQQQQQLRTYASPSVSTSSSSSSSSSSAAAARQRQALVRGVNVATAQCPPAPLAHHQQQQHQQHQLQSMQLNGRLHSHLPPLAMQSSLMTPLEQQAHAASNGAPLPPQPLDAYQHLAAADLEVPFLGGASMTSPPPAQHYQTQTTTTPHLRTQQQQTATAPAHYSAQHYHLHRHPATSLSSSDGPCDGNNFHPTYRPATPTSAPLPSGVMRQAPVDEQKLIYAAAAAACVSAATAGSSPGSLAQHLL